MCILYANIDEDIGQDRRPNCGSSLPYSRSLSLSLYFSFFLFAFLSVLFIYIYPIIVW